MELAPKDAQFYIAVAAGVALAFLLLALKPPERKSIRKMLLVLGVFLALRLLGVVCKQFGMLKTSGLLFTLAVLGVGAVLIRFAGMLLFRVALPAVGVAPPRIVEDLFITVLFAGGFLFFLHLSGVQLSGLLATSAVITAVLAFAMQETLGNVLGGVVLQLDDSLKVGDWVKIDDTSGQVVDVRWRYTAIETRNRETVVIPNGWLVKNKFTVIGSRRDGSKLRWRRWVWFNIDLGVPPVRVCQVLEDAVRDGEIANAVLDPPPSAVLMETSLGYGRYALRYWVVDPRPDDPTDSAVRTHALAALARQGIKLAVVQEERLLIKDNEARRESLRAEAIERGRAALAGVDLFGNFTEAELTALAEKLTIAPFVKGCTITRQGRVAHWLYLIISGDADVWVEDNGKRTHIATLKPGSVFGEMGMMTGEPRRATVTARTDMECLRLGKAGFESVLRARPDIAAEISRVIIARRGELDTAREAASADAVAQPQHEALMSRIRGFFGLDQ